MWRRRKRRSFIKRPSPRLHLGMVTYPLAVMVNLLAIRHWEFDRVRVVVSQNSFAIRIMDGRV